ASVRSEVVALAQHLLAQGATANSVASEIGLAGSTVRSWLKSAAVAGPAFVPVVVEPDHGFAAAPGPSPAPPTPRSIGLTLISPRGFRLEGLDLNGAVTALLRLS
ncbi:MAG: hypothetical protein GXP48_08640, partial [Acidobacteria bacterium]|nr:hypothetical protein [Acidobacteriota bacterium]